MAACDVDEIVFTLSNDPSEPMKEEIRRWGIECRTVAGDEP
jgi:hypothetical protein